MFGMGPFEILIVAAIALVIIGPEKFPEFAKIFMRTVSDIRGYVNEVKSEVEKEVKPMQNEIRQLSKYRPEQYIDSLVKDADEDKSQKAGSGEAEISGAGDNASQAYDPSEPTGDAGPTPYEFTDDTEKDEYNLEPAEGDLDDSHLRDENGNLYPEYDPEYKEYTQGKPEKEPAPEFPERLD